MLYSLITLIIVIIIINLTLFEPKAMRVSYRKSKNKGKPYYLCSRMKNPRLLVSA